MGAVSDASFLNAFTVALSFFGASKFDPKSDLWTRVTLFQGAPVLEDVSAMDADDWSFPVMGTVGD